MEQVAARLHGCKAFEKGVVENHIAYFHPDSLAVFKREQAGNAPCSNQKR